MEVAMLAKWTSTAFHQLAEVMLRFKGPTTEHDYRSGKETPRYVREMVYPDLVIDAVPAREFSAEDLEIEAAIERLGEAAGRFPWFAKVEDEHVFVRVVDANDLRFTVDFDHGTARLTRGWDTSRPPTLVLPVDRQNIANMAEVLAGGQLTYEQLYRIVYVIAPAAVRRVYSIPLLREPGDKSWIGMDDFVHLVIPPTEPVVYHGRPIRIELTIVNVDGQWIIVDGLHGDPDARFELTLEDAARWYTFAVYDLPKVKGTRELLKVATDVAAVTKKTMTYLRKDHR
jgi:hypothetical protein